MDTSDWLVTQVGECLPCDAPRDDEFPASPYRLYRFLTDVEDILRDRPEDEARLAAIRPLVRRLLVSSDWLQGEYRAPDPQTGWSVVILYDEPDFPLTVQMVAWLPGKVSPIHNHGTWGVVAVVSGEEKNTLWKRSPTPEFPDRIESVGDRIFLPGEIISFLPDAIHCIEAMGEEPTITFNLYGVTDYQRRFEFNPRDRTAHLF
ncbi:cupin [Phormidium sp. CCY1219]|uniref:cysteine dioxygenase family protein n=1 Tax=Phormidium sp. CCY1219 TaxID=2886104 RepID=UPI002D1E88C4|nr:cupin [Phormidium sp. CCY1219]MEB3827430.1 cupin [Phormidium sp. CCY1219]